VWEREICSVRELDIIPCNAVVSEIIWGQHLGFGTGIIEKAERYTAEIIECGREKLEVQQGWIFFIVML
jgi:histone acetyltransferase (RNA polymerase elongator complex component)